ncbi:MAG: hypothetical protein ACJ8R9_31115 [Steroidobacteraceae bacterium]
MSLTLPGADLGEVGESKFKLLCSQARLVCNKSSRDVTGWDFIVEFPLADPSSALALDQRRTNTCHVQLKSTAATADIGRVSLRLSAIERPAKDARPALIVVFLLRPDGEGVAGYLIHLSGEQLARVLKRLRDAQARKALDINRAVISFDYRKVGKRFALTPDGLREALAAACGSDPARYILQKQRQLEELGYENGSRLQAEALIWVEGPEHLNDILLGLKPVRPERIRVFDSRFGIRIPYQGALFDDIAELTLTPPFVGTCRVSIRGADLSPAAIFTAEIYIGPPIEIGGPQLLIRHSDFTLKLKPDRLEFQTLGDFTKETRPLQRWTELIRALCHLAYGRGSLTIFETVRFPRISMPVEQPIEGPYLEQLPQLIRFLDGWQQLLSMAGVVSNADFSLEEIWAARQAVIAVDVMVNPASTCYFEFQTLGESNLGGSTVHALYFNSGKLADAAVSYCAKVTFQRTTDSVWQYRSTAFEPLDVRPVIEDMEEYAAEKAASHGLKVIIDPANLTLSARGEVDSGAD